MDLFSLKGIGAVRAENLRAVGITSLRDLLYTLPVCYEDHETVYPCATCPEGPVLVAGIIADAPVLQRYHGLTKVSVHLMDNSGKLTLQWFNAPWMTKNLPVGAALKFYGRLTVKNGRRALQNPHIVTETGWLPVYRAVPGFPAKTFRKLMDEGLKYLDACCPETLPEAFREEHGLCSLKEALLNTHHPGSMDQLRDARRRLNFERMLMYLLYVSMRGNHRHKALPMAGCVESAAEYWGTLSFTPTGAQVRVLEEISTDLMKNTAMARMVQGDVGCGKTAVAFGAITCAVRSGFQAAMMAPTEILARQHFENASATLGTRGIRCGLLTGSTRAAERRELLRRLRDGELDVLFGTHALFSRDVEYPRLGLVITDEQHRFGVRQRSHLMEKGKTEEIQPHVLVMSATPIPRSLALILYGDLDLSVVDELPAGRKPVQTRMVPESRRADMYAFLREEIRKGRQAYVVCPLVEDGEEEETDAKSDEIKEARSAKTVWEELQKTDLAGARIGLTWGAQKSEEKAETLRAFQAGEYDVLVATTVIEVGVNNPNATIMVIENAGRFGLSQLHQLRGRVGRGDLESWCFLLSDKLEKLKILLETNDGFLVSRKDLEQRGPGDLTGTRQSGEALEGFLLDGDVRLLDEVSQCVRALHREPEKHETLARLEALAEEHFRGREIEIS